MRNPGLIEAERTIDTWLLGSRQSDLRKTRQSGREWRELPEAKVKKLKRMFGKFRVRFTRTRIYTDFDGDKSVVPNQVVAKDAHRVAILARGIIAEDEQQIYTFTSKAGTTGSGLTWPAFPSISGESINGRRRLIGRDDACHGGSAD